MCLIDYLLSRIIAAISTIQAMEKDTAFHRGQRARYTRSPRTCNRLRIDSNEREEVKKQSNRATHTVKHIVRYMERVAAEVRKQDCHAETPACPVSDLRIASPF